MMCILGLVGHIDAAMLGANINQKGFASIERHTACILKFKVRAMRLGDRDIYRSKTGTSHISMRQNVAPGIKNHETDTIEVSKLKVLLQELDSHGTSICNLSPTVWRVSFFGVTVVMGPAGACRTKAVEAETAPPAALARTMRNGLGLRRKGLGLHAR